MINFLKITAKKLLNLINVQLIGANKKIIYYHNLNHDLPLIINRTKPVIFDIGANKGQSIKIFTKMFPKSKIIAFEPNKKLVLYLKNKYSGNRVKIHSFACGSKKIIKQMNFYAETDLSSFLKIDKNKNNPFKTVKIINQNKIKIVTLDSYCIKNKVKNIDLLKIDTQGFDLEVLKGAKRVLLNKVVKNVLIEINYISLYKKQASPQAIFTELEKYGFKMISFYDIVRKENQICWANVLFGFNKPKQL